MSNPRGPNRRQFTAALGLLAAPLVSPGAAATDASPSPAEQMAVAAASLTAIVRTRHGKHLTKAQIRQIELGIFRSLYAAGRMRKFPLKNSDEPAFTFSAELS